MKKKETPPPEPPFDIRNWLTQPPPAEEVKGEVGAQYIPIGIIENLLDRFDSWGTSEFVFKIFRTDKFWFADASVLLNVDSTSSGTFYKNIVGAVTYQISSKDENQDHAATALSLATANAAKKLGIRFGRALNNRLTVGDVLPVIKVEREKKLKPSEEEKRWQDLFNDCQTKEDVESYKLVMPPSFKKVYNKLLKKLPTKEEFEKIISNPKPYA